MHLLTAATGLLAASLLGAMGGPSLSPAIFAPESRTTHLTGQGCEADPALPAAMRRDGRAKRCPGLGGARVVVSSNRNGVGLGFAWSPRERSDGVLRSRTLDSRIEWRGIPTARGFDPYAAIVRVRVRDSGEAEDGSVLAVMRVRRGEACLVGLVDAAATPDAASVAHRLADERARNVACGRDAPWIEGVATPRVIAVAAAP